MSFVVECKGIVKNSTISPTKGLFQLRHGGGQDNMKNTLFNNYISKGLEGSFITIKKTELVCFLVYQ